MGPLRQPDWHLQMNGVEPYSSLRDLFTSLANGHLDKDIHALMPWAYAQPAIASQ